VKKLISYMLVFVLGFGACAYILYRLGYTTPAVSGDSVLRTLTGRPAPPIISRGRNPIADAVDKLGPAVVNIDTVAERRIENPFPDLFGLPIPAPKQILMGKGSGVIISKDGYILTNNHVVAGAQQIKVRLSDGRSLSAKLIGRDERTELAVIKVNAANLPVAKLGDSDRIRVGDWAIAIGNPIGFGNSVTVGVISAKKREEVLVEGKTLYDVIQTDASINPGNSGGALANIDGQVIGINTAIYSTVPGGGNIGIGFAIPINSATGVVKQLIEKGRVVRPWLGVYIDNLSGDLAAWYEQHGYKAKQGAVVMHVMQRSPAEKTGLMQGDIITEIDGRRVSSAADVQKLIGKRKVGQVVRLSIWRAGKTKLVGVRLAEMPQNT
jgi:Do/DeqQ family serine protease